jgi:phosphoribosylaminoimidazole carboxylase (NCAIR synthetase)
MSLWFDSLADALLQDKFRQKEHFSKFGIPLPDFVEVIHYHLTFVALLLEF